MKTENFPYPNVEIQNAILDTIRLIDIYRLHTKTTKDGDNRIWVGGKNRGFIDFSLLVTSENSSQLILSASGLGTKLSEIQEEVMINEFLIALKRVLKKEILLTPEILNRDPHKPVDSTQAIMQAIILIVAAIAIFYALQALF